RDEGLVDADPLERDDGHRRHGDHAVEADRLWAEQAGDDEPLGQDEQVDEAEHGGIDHRPAHHAGAQLAAWEVEPAAHAALRRRRSTASTATAARTTIDGSAAKR